MKFNGDASLQSFIIGEEVFHLFVPDAEQVEAAYKSGEIAFPYWSKVWPAAIALSEFLQNNTQYTKNKRVLELAAGLGLPSLVATRNATSVICSDYSTEAVELIKRSADYNKLSSFQVRLLDWLDLPGDLEADVLLLSDINYNPAVFDVQQGMINRFLQKNTAVILSTPQRLMAKEFIAPLLIHCKEQAEIIAADGEQEIMITVIALEKR